MQAPTPWINSYPAGLRWDAEITVRPVDQILDEAVSGHPDRAAIDFMGRLFSYREFGQLVARAAKGLQALGVRPGVHVGLFLAHTPQYLVSCFAVLKAGGVVVNYSPLDAEQVLAHKVADSQTDLLITLDSPLLYPQMDRLLATTRLKTLVVGTVGEMTANPAAIAAQLQAAGQSVDVAWDARRVTFASLLDNDGAYQPHDIGDPSKALAVLQYTGGTTGSPKGAMLTHGNLSAANQQCWLTCVRGGADLQEGAERILAVLPPFHIYALSVNMLLGVRLAATQRHRRPPSHQPEDRLAPCVSFGEGGQRLVVERQHLVAVGAELQRLRRVVVGDQQVAAALGEPQHRIMHIERDQSRLDAAEAASQGHQPVREKGEGQRVRDGELDHVLPAGAVRSHQVARRLQRHQDLQRLGMQGFAGRRQPRGVVGAVDQVDAGPGFQCLDASRKRRLGDVPQLCRP